MNKQSNNKEDLLTQYISREKIEQAPEGFTSRVMNQVRLEPLPAAVKERFWKKNLVPVLSVIITLSLIGVVFLIPENQIDTATLPVFKLIKNLELSIPEMDLSSLFTLTLPSITLYIIISIVFLTIFDKALSGIFKRR